MKHRSQTDFAAQVSLKETKLPGAAVDEEPRTGRTGLSHAAIAAIAVGGAGGVALLAIVACVLQSYSPSHSIWSFTLSNWKPVPSQALCTHLQTVTSVYTKDTLVHNFGPCTMQSCM